MQRRQNKVCVPTQGCVVSPEPPVINKTAVTSVLMLRKSGASYILLV